jgi:hypothetical protein
LRLNQPALQFIAKGHELVYSGDDAVLFLEWWQWN